MRALLANVSGCRSSVLEPVSDRITQAYRAISSIVSGNLVGILWLGRYVTSYPPFSSAAISASAPSS